MSATFNATDYTPAEALELIAMDQTPCEECEQIHPYRPHRPGLRKYGGSWAADDGHAYRRMTPQAFANIVLWPPALKEDT